MRLIRRPAWFWDMALPLLAAALLVFELRPLWSEPRERFGVFLPPNALTVLLQAMILGALVLRRRTPHATLAVVLLTSYCYQALGYVALATTDIAAMVALFSAAAYGRRIPRAAAFAVIGVWLLGIHAARPVQLAPGDFVILYVVFAGSWVLGERERGHREHAAMLEEHNALLRRQRELEAEQAAVSERTRIARELHDVIAHGLGVVVVQSEAATLALHDDVAEAGRALDVIRSTSRSALGETRRVLGLMRDGAGRTAHAPQPGIAELPALVRDFEAAGFDVQLCTQGEPRALDPGVALSVYASWRRRSRTRCGMRRRATHGSR